jgi:hypothetical protein
LVYFLGVSGIEDEEAGCEGSGGKIERRTYTVVRSVTVVVVEMRQIGRGERKKKLQWRW